LDLNKYIEKSIVDVLEITHIKLIAIASLDKKITIFNLNKMLYISTIDFTQPGMPSGGVHHCIYSYDY